MLSLHPFVLERQGSGEETERTIRPNGPLGIYGRPGLWSEGRAAQMVPVSVGAMRPAPPFGGE